MAIRASSPDERTPTYVIMQPGSGNMPPGSSSHLLQPNAGGMPEGWAGDMNDEACVPEEHCWGSVEYLHWWIKDGPIVPLVTTGNILDKFPGAIGQLGTMVLFGGSDLDYDGISGIRLGGGLWMDDARTLGLEVSGFLLEQHAVGFHASSNDAGNPYLARPFFNAIEEREDFAEFTYPNNVVGRIDIGSSSQLWGFEANALGNLCRHRRCSVNLLAGFRYLNLQEDLRIYELYGPIDGGPNQVGQVFFNGQIFDPGVQIYTADVFRTSNEFYGGQIGLSGEYRTGKLGLVGTFKLGLGVTRQEVGIAGQSVLIEPYTALPGGLLALPSNIGHSSKNQFSIVPELGIKVYYQVTDNVRVFAGYNLLYWTSVARPGDQIDRSINPKQVPTFKDYGGKGGPVAPVRQVRDSDFWAQGVSIGLEIRY